MNKPKREDSVEKIIASFNKNAGNISAVSRETGYTRGNIRHHLRKNGLLKKPVAGGGVHGIVREKALLPAKGLIKRYLLTSAQNNTLVNRSAWDAFVTLADHYDAEILVGTFSYNQNHYGELSVKQGTKKSTDRELWFDPEIRPFICDRRIQLAPGLVWCGEMNMLPTAVDPLSGLETYSHRESAIFPHAKLAMRSIATMQGEGTKLNYTTGTVTLKNYIQKKEGLKAEHHHRYACLIVEVNHEGNWWVRQVGASSRTKRIQDLDVVVEAGEVTTGNAIEAVTWGDLHATMVEPWVVECSMDILDTLSPRYQFLHDVLEGASVNRHQVKDNNPHYGFHRWLRGLHRVTEELRMTKDVIEKYFRPGCKILVPDSNHDGWWLRSWLAKYDYRVDPANAELFLKLQAFMYEEIRLGKMPKDVNITARALQEAGLDLEKVRFLLADESFKICGDKIECGQHGHLGPDGSRGTPGSLNKIGRRANTAHTHSTGIWNGLYVAGTSSKLKWSYNYGPSSWSHSHVFTYSNGQRSIITMYNGAWRA